MLGSSGLEVSELTLGCMSFGESGRGTHEWTVGEVESREIIAKALEAGISTFDTANMYSLGSSEEIVGRALRDFARRDEIVIATKVFHRMRPGLHGEGLSRKSILAEVDASLTRLGTDYIDLYQIHRWDPRVPVEETLQVLHDLVASGKVRYIGASSMFAWQFAKYLFTADLMRVTRFIGMQDHYNLLNREEEREMHPLCVDQGVGVLVWSPLARGRLARPAGEQTGRSRTDGFASSLYDDEADAPILDAIGSIAASRGASRAQVALAWVRQQPTVTSTIVGATSVSQLDAAVASLGLELSADELAALTSPYRPREAVGFS